MNYYKRLNVAIKSYEVKFFLIAKNTHKGGIWSDDGNRHQLCPVGIFGWYWNSVE